MTEDLMSLYAIRSIPRLVVALVIALGVLPGCFNERNVDETKTRDAPIARVDEDAIARAELIAARPSATVTARRATLNALIDIRVAVREARRRGLHESDDLAATIDIIHMEAAKKEREVLRDALYRAVRAELAISESDLLSHYEETKQRYAERQVVLMRSAYSSRAAATKALAQGGLYALTSPTSPRSTEKLGPLPLAQLPPSVLPEAAYLRNVGDRRLAEADDGGWSVIELVEIRAAEPRAFEEVRDAVEKNYRVRKGSEALRTLLSRLRQQTTITIDDDALSDAANWQ